MSDNKVITAEMLTALPEPVQRYLNYTGIVGTPWIESVQIQQTGQFRLAADRPWMPVKAKQWYRTASPAFEWQARFSLFGLPLLSAKDSYANGHGHMFGKLAGVKTIFDLRGEELDQGTMLRYLNEMMWFPAAFLGENIAWNEIDDNIAQAIFTDGGKSVSATLFFDDEGRLTNFKTMRYREINGSFSLDRWATPITRYGVLAGLNLPVAGQAVWHLPEGDLVYADLEIVKVEYNTL